MVVTWRAEVKELAGTNNIPVFPLVILLEVLLHLMVVARLRVPTTRVWTADLRSQHHLPMDYVRKTTEPTAGGWSCSAVSADDEAKTWQSRELSW